MIDACRLPPIRFRSHERTDMNWLQSVVGLRYNKNANAAGAQTERRGVATRPVRAVVSQARTSPANFQSCRPVQFRAAHWFVLLCGPLLHSPQRFGGIALLDLSRSQLGFCPLGKPLIASARQ